MMRLGKWHDIWYLEHLLPVVNSVRSPLVVVDPKPQIGCRQQWLESIASELDY
jgi:hypothetical protein